MKRLRIIFCLLLLGLGAVQTACAGAIEFVQPDLQLGTIGADQQVTAAFQLTNGTDAAIKIVDTDASCRCTSLQKAPDAIPAHGVGKFEWLFNASRSSGPVTQTVTAITDGGQAINGQFTVNVKFAPSLDGSNVVDHP